MLRTAGSCGDSPRETMPCRADTICAVTRTGSTPISGLAPWLPTPVTTTSKKAPPAMAEPGRIEKRPVSRFGRLCSP